MSILRFLGLERGPEEQGADEFASSAEAMRGVVERLERLDPQRARYVAHFAYVLGRVANADLEVSEVETRAMEREVRALGGLDEAEAVLVVEIAKTQHRLFGATDSFSITREFATSATPDQKRELLECLFAVSAADENVSGVEESEIRRIVKELDLHHEDFIAARASYREHVARLRGGPPAQLPDIDSLWDFDHPDSSEAAFGALLPLARASGNSEYLAQLLTQVARAEGLQMKFDHASRTLDEAESLITPETPTARVRLLLERGRLLNSSKRRDESKPFFRQAWDLAREAGAGGLAVDAAHMLGIVESGDASIAWNREAIAYAEASSDPKARGWLGSLYNNLGWTYHDAGDAATALDLFRKALAAREAERSDRAPGLVRIARWCVARALRTLGRTDEALAMQRELLAQDAAAHAPDGYVHEEIGELLLLRGDAEGAKPHFASAWKTLSEDPWLRRDEPDRLERMRRQGGLAE